MSPLVTTQSRSDRRGESGQAIVEFAIILPLVLLVLFAIVDLSKAFNYWNDTQQLANVAARFAAVGDNPSSSDTLANAIKNMADTTELRQGGGGDGVQSPGVTVCIQNRDTNGDGSIGVGDAVTAEVSATYNWLKAIQFSAAQTTMRGRATMRIERLPPGGGSLTTSCTTTGL